MAPLRCHAFSVEERCGAVRLYTFALAFRSIPAAHRLRLGAASALQKTPSCLTLLSSSGRFESFFMSNVIDGSQTASDAPLYLTDLRHYEVRPAGIGYAVLHTNTRALIAVCAQLDTARAVADSREWADRQDADNEVG